MWYKTQVIELRGSKSFKCFLLGMFYSKKQIIMESRPVSAMGRAIERLKMKKKIQKKINHINVLFVVKPLFQNKV